MLIVPGTQLCKWKREGRMGGERDGGTQLCPPKGQRLKELSTVDRSTERVSKDTKIQRYQGKKTKELRYKPTKLSLE